MMLFYHRFMMQRLNNRDEKSVNGATSQTDDESSKSKPGGVFTSILEMDIKLTSHLGLCASPG